MTKAKLAVLAAAVLASGLAMSAPNDGRRTYIVQLTDEPAVTYQGGVAGLAATRAVAGSKFEFQRSEVQAYVGHLRRQQSEVAATVGRTSVLATYHAVFNGFSARLTPAEVASLRANNKVANVFVDEVRQMDTVSTPRFLGLTAPGGLWSQTAGGSLVKGEGMVIGVVDGGIWPEGPSFFDRVDSETGAPVKTGGTLAYGPAPATFKGSCQAGEGFTPALHCNNKLIGAKFYNAGFLASGLPKNWSEFYSPRDSMGGNLAHGGHGDHTASTVAGNSGVQAVVNGVPMGAQSGMAPRARVASYKVCWSYDDATATDGTGSRNSCFNSDSVAAIDDAVKDGVNAINFSISGSQTSSADPVEQAFYRATLAGVFVAASAGNSGPANQVAHISPWLTTVAASTHDRALTATVTLGTAAVYTGASVNVTPLPAKSVILSTDAVLAGAAVADANLCFSSPATLDPAKVAGKIVVCTRGTNARIDKSAAVAAAGGVGMILVDNGAGLVAEAHSVPTVHVNAADGTAIKTYVATSGSTAALSAFGVGSTPAPIMAGFSSRGPNQGDSNILKPDVTAPGVDVIAAVSSAGGTTVAEATASRNAIVAGTLVPPPAWSSYQGTSMSSPHVAGIALLLKQAHPTWSPSAIKSALMTTAYPTLDDGQPGAANGKLPWAQGAGHIDPNKATDPGLVYDAGKLDYDAYQCKVNRASVTAADCAASGTLGETYNLNLPSITLGAVVGSATVTRTVTNVGSATATYTATVSGLTGFTAVVTPATFTLAPGAKQTFTVRLAATTAVENVWSFGALTWADGTHVVRSPVQARTGKAIVAPAEMTGTTVSGTRLFTVKTGFAGRMTGIKGGLKDVTMSAPMSLSPGAASSAQLKAICTAGADTANVKVMNVTIPAGTVVAKFALRQADVGSADDDYDMMLLSSTGSSLYSGNDGSNESVQIASPAAGNYKVCVVLYGSNAASSTFKLSSWIVTPADVGGNFNVLLPGQVYAAGTSTVGMAWSGLTPGKRYLGGVQFLDLSGVAQATTVLSVNP
jgi:Subtilase family/Fibronectin type-III domain/PA domain/Peptidase inhibitor I9